jgi:hypothetical protein
LSVELGTLLQPAKRERERTRGCVKSGAIRNFIVASTRPMAGLSKTFFEDHTKKSPSSLVIGSFLEEVEPFFKDSLQASGQGTRRG